MKEKEKSKTGRGDESDNRIWQPGDDSQFHAVSKRQAERDADPAGDASPSRRVLWA